MIKAKRDPEPSKAEQRQLAVEKLKRAASLPRMKDGRRPPIHVENISEGEEPSTDIPEFPSQSSPLVDISLPRRPTESEPDQETGYLDVSSSLADRSKRHSSADSDVRVCTESGG